MIRSAPFKQTAIKQNPVRYSVPMLLLVSFCLLLAQHYLPSVIHGGMDSNYLLAQSSGNLARQISYLTLGMIGLLGVRYAVQSRQTPFRWNYWIVVPLALLLAWCVLTLLWSEMPAIAAKRLLVVGLMFLGSFGLAVSWKPIDIVRFIAVSSALDVTIGLAAEIVSGYFHPASADYRFAGTLTPNEQGYLCMVLAISSICMVRMSVSAGAPSWLYRLFVPYGVIFLLLTRSRGALMSLGIAILFYFLFVMQARKKVLLTLLLGSFLLGLAVTGVGTQLLNALDRGGEGDQDFTGRAPLWTELMEYVDERPWTGHGYESFWNAQTMDDVYKHQHWPVESAHSEYVESLLTIGIIGMVLHTLALLAGTVEGIRLFRSEHNSVFFLASTFCCIYLVGGSLEAILIVKPSPISFYLAMLFSSMMVRPHTAEVPVRSKNPRQFTFHQRKAKPAYTLHLE